MVAIQGVDDDSPECFLLDSRQLGPHFTLGIAQDRPECSISSVLEELSNRHTHNDVPFLGFPRAGVSCPEVDIGRQVAEMQFERTFGLAAKAEEEVDGEPDQEDGG